MSRRSEVRMMVVQILILSLLVTLVGRLWYLQVRNGDKYEQAAAANQMREIVMPAVRGQILDALGRPLVNNRNALVVSVSRTDLLRQKDRGKATLQRLSGVLGMKYEELRQRISICGPKVPKPCWNGSAYQPIPVTDKADNAMAMQIMEKREQFPGVVAEPRSLRNYPAIDGLNGAHVLGYLSPVSESELEKQRAAAEAGQDVGKYERSEMIGRAGLERQYNDALRGTPGVKRVAVDHLGRVINTMSEQSSVPGNHLVTSINARVQAALEKELQTAVDRGKSQFDPRTRRHYVSDGAAGVVMNAKTGQIVAMASWPTYDPNIWADGITKAAYQDLVSQDKNVPMLNRPIQSQMAPGSVFKVISVAGAAAGGHRPESKYACPGSMFIAGRTFRNWNPAGEGSIDMGGALAHSCDTVFYSVAYDMWMKDGGIKPIAAPADHMVNMAKKFGLGARTGIDLPGEGAGRVVDRAWKRQQWEKNKALWCQQAEDQSRSEYARRVAHENCVDFYQYRAGDAVNFSIGQGDTTATPLQIARVYAAVANGGTLWQPTVAKAVVTPTGQVVQAVKPKATKLDVDPGVLDFIRQGLVRTVTEGTASGAFRGWPSDTVQAAAKTGTAQVYGKQSTAWFASFTPANDPKYVAVMMVSQGGEGSRTPGPSVAAIQRALNGIDPEGEVLPANSLVTDDAGGDKLPKVRPDGVIVQPAPAPEYTPSTIKGQPSAAVQEQEQSESPVADGPADDGAGAGDPQQPPSEGPGGDQGEDPGTPSPGESGGTGGQDPGDGRGTDDRQPLPAAEEPRRGRKGQAP